MGLILDLLASWLLYDQFLAAVFLSPAAILWISDRIRLEKKKEKEKLLLEFRDGINSLASSLKTGRSAVNAFGEAALSLEQLYGRESRMADAFRRVKAETEISIPLETAVQHMAERFGISEIQSFAGVFQTARRTGGELGRIIAETSETIGERIETENEIAVMLHGRRFERNIMRAVPPFMILYLRITSNGYLDVMYQSLYGRGVMMLCALTYLASWYLGERFTEIEV